jgi:hypothetical protein
MVVSHLLLLFLTIISQCSVLVPAFLRSSFLRSRPLGRGGELWSQINLSPSVGDLRIALQFRKSKTFQKRMKQFSKASKHHELSRNEKDELISTLTVHWLSGDVPEGEMVAMRNLGGILSARNEEDKLLLDSLVAKYLSPLSKSCRSFPLFWTSLGKLDYQWNLFDNTTKARVQEIFNSTVNAGRLKGKEYRDLLAGIVDLGMKWEDVEERTRSTLLSRFGEFSGQLKQSHLSSLILYLGKLKICLPPEIKRYILERTERETASQLLREQKDLEERKSIVRIFSVFILQLTI